MKVQEMVNNQYASSPLELEDIKEEKKVLIYRHIAWMTALRYAMRQRKSWETSHLSRSNRKWADLLHIPEKISSLEDNLMLYLSAEEEQYVLSKSNKQTAILYLQSKHIGKLKEKGIIWEFSFLELENVLGELFIHQGKSERIKNFPYPRQYASLAYYLVKLFVVLLPFGIVSEFADIAKYISINHPSVGSYFIWLSVPFCACVSWAFHIMERMARIGENPFEGGPNDVPISTISRGIEIDLREMLDENKNDIPGQFPEDQNVQM
jgi:putative membrane protein